MIEFQLQRIENGGALFVAEAEPRRRGQSGANRGISRNQRVTLVRSLASLGMTARTISALLFSKPSSMFLRRKVCAPRSKAKSRLSTLSGGVSCNRELREKLRAACQKSGIEVR